MLLEYEFSFKNRPLFAQDFPDHMTDRTSLLQIAEYNNRHHGIIDNNFLKWALKNYISYEAVLWFVKNFSGQTDQELLWLIDAYFFPIPFIAMKAAMPLNFALKMKQAN